jgi:putative ABC transport system ATP-binding protein
LIPTVGGPESKPDRTATIVEARGVKKTYRAGPITVEALRGIDLDVKAHEMISVMGPSGCGKTTLLNCLSGLDDLSEGQVKVGGIDVHKMPDGKKSEFRARKMGFIFQSYNLLPVLTARENVELPLLVSRMKESDAETRAIEALRLVDLADWQNHKPAELSGGQQQRVAIARALVNQPAIVWADEPTGNLDSEHSQEIVGLLRRLNREVGLALILVTHDPSIARRTDRIIQMKNGAIERVIDASEFGADS